MIIDTNQMIPITKLQKELTKRIREVSEQGSPLFVLKNNEMEAVILSPENYEYLINLSELVEYAEIEDIITKRMETYDRSRNLKWEAVKK